MELEELKQKWDKLEYTIEKSMKMNLKIAEEMHQSRYNRSISVLINYTYLGCIVALLVMIGLFCKITTTYFGPFKITIFILAIILLASGLIVGFTNLKLLFKIDYSKSINHNIALTRTYQIRIKRQSLIASILILILIILGIIASLLSPNMELWRWVTIGFILVIGIIIAKWEYKNIYKKNIETLLKSLDELNELAED